MNTQRFVAALNKRYFKGVIRCFNVLYYFDDSFFENALKWLAKTTREEGVVLIGGNWAASTECYYNVSKKQGDVLVNKEFAFSLDCINPIGIVTWFANYDDDRQTNQLLKYISILRKDKVFMETFHTFNDGQRKKYGICPRDEQGYYGIPDPTINPQELWVRVGAMSQEFHQSGLSQQAADVLKRTGLHAIVNEVGHLAVIPNKQTS
uniref:Uncharacterized protein n=1 Tax=Roseihalotalea indica TaxID=2867963 RepID=A0AA49JIJ8_9BACT|nr:hypothetical protein K4G66_24005 [Tunicatimonas sp. TK19036]